MNHQSHIILTHPPLQYPSSHTALWLSFWHKESIPAHSAFSFNIEIAPYAIFNLGITLESPAVSRPVNTPVCRGGNGQGCWATPSISLTRASWASEWVNYKTLISILPFIYKPDSSYCVICWWFYTTRRQKKWSGLSGFFILQPE